MMKVVYNFLINCVVCSLVSYSFANGIDAEERQPNKTSLHSPIRKVLLIVADDLRADVTSVYGGPARTPNLENLAARGTLFRRATCGFPVCHVSRSEILCGRHLVAETAEGRAVQFDPEWKLWPQVMRDGGWRTIHFGKWHVSGSPAKCGFTDSFALMSAEATSTLPPTIPRTATGRVVTGYPGWTFKDFRNHPLMELGVGLTPETDEYITNTVISVIRKTSDQPLCLHVNFTAPHDPLLWPRGYLRKDHADPDSLPKNFLPSHPFDHGSIQGRDEMIVPAPRSAEDVLRERAVYEAVVEQLDSHIGRIFRAISETDSLDRWLIIFTSDQGLALGSHGLMGKQNQYDHTINTPLIVAGPNVTPGKSLEAQCALRDIYPTVCDLAGLPIPKSVQGTRLRGLLSGETECGADVIYGYFTDTQRMMRTAEGWKLIWYPKLDRKQLFHIPEDEYELHDLSSDLKHQQRLATMYRKLQTWLREQGDPCVADLAER